MTKEEKDEIQHILSTVFEKIKNGHLEGGWNVYDEFEMRLKKFMDKDKPSTQIKDLITKIANICTELTKINSQGKSETCYSLQQVYDCFDAYEESYEKGREYYKALENFVKENGGPEIQGRMYNPKI